MTVDIKTYCPKCTRDYVIELPLTCTLETFNEMLIQDGWDLGSPGPMVICQECAKKLRGSGGGEDGNMGTPAI